MSLSITKNKTVRIAVVVVLILGAIAMLVSGIMHRIDYWKSGIFEYEIRNFGDYKKSFRIIADKVLQLSKEFKKEYGVDNFFVDPWGDKLKVTVYNQETELNGKTVPLSQEEIVAYENIMNAFSSAKEAHGEGTYCAHYENQTVMFFGGGSPYRICYAPHGKPEYSYGDSPAFIDRISWNWYQIFPYD